MANSIINNTTFARFDVQVKHRATIQIQLQYKTTHLHFSKTAIVIVISSCRISRQIDYIFDRVITIHHSQLSEFKSEI